MSDYLRFDGWCKDEACPVVGEHEHGNAAWSGYWRGLTMEQQQWLRNKARWEHISVSAVATEWGAPTPKEPE